MRRPSLLLALLAGASACSLPVGNEAARERTAAASQAIQGGAVEPALPNVGMLEFSTGNFGTATLITPRVVLTAGHVVGGNIQGFYTGAGKPVYRGPDFSTSAAMTKHGVKEKKTHPSYECKSDCAKYPTSLDVGLVLLDAPAPEYVPVALGGGTLAVGSACSTTGYGDHVVDWNAPDAAPQVKQKRSAAVKLVALDTSTLEAEWVTGIADHGDSGGPLFCDGALVGTTAFHTDGDDEAHRREVYQRVDAVLPWIHEQLLAWGDATLEAPPAVDAGPPGPPSTGDASAVPPADPGAGASPASSDGGCSASGAGHAGGGELALLAALVVVVLAARRRGHAG
ncbi:MAG: hypothetical protein JWP97_3548 [Labilithrix sp.]|nr:hypothetical protein [Labilithrix sp.]